MKATGFSIETASTQNVLCVQSDLIGQYRNVIKSKEKLNREVGLLYFFGKYSGNLDDLISW